ncbi:type II secretion system protein GspE [candidate division WOR-1 bacterium RIFOXYB2_FULL_42_35]|uniref:Type II secretion system protein GspE n=1 Tax=candidate division WOR-1 bacterium RIFOXYC2_FULL_41_25 TaxID=1802586 RepID=A0A1F4TNB5_UNCSA|nr:MAG: type II secretion system protein GspE [candidate division WOR-1 bacterium RIFOXYA2_FULL_41_14]OGC24318.1 MAG: type II secretion system protein GspE [candidate division WOR-1 bacterium RIFOXYB2_FULL_42_35]OGC34020.1 MAG: type II secretion system protein GspE [candidate division WOR-1 bacterium RIFOXYC2_FULL_41_25]
MVDRGKSLQDSLVKSKLLSEDQVKLAAQEGRKAGKSLIKSILEKNLVDENSLISFLEKEMDIPRVDLSSYLVDQKIVKLLPHVVADKYKVIPLFKVGDVLTIAMVDPFDIMALDEVRAKTKCDVEPMVASLRDIEQAINQYYGMAGTVADLVKNIGPEESTSRLRVKESVGDEAPITKLVNLLILRAVSEKASDIHIEPTTKEVRIRYRVDGIMHDVSSAPIYLHSAIITRIKVMSSMDIAESRVPQDGRFELKTAGKGVDMRVSSYPTIYGEAIVMRLLDKSSVQIGLEDLGFGEKNLQIFAELIKRPYGIVLVTGPTGSGKTTTLYATLNRIVDAEKNIMTIEDPVEYELYGVRQAQVNVKAGMEFAGALRSMLRQDPDVILVGEIRDSETAKVAIQAALTGHLVFSTLHTNDAAGALNRLVDMGVETFLVTSSVAATIAQRLVRTICPHCKISYEPPKELLDKFALGEGKGYQFYRGKGCKSCKNTGYRGRISIYEILVLDDNIRALVMKKAPTSEVKKAAIAAGMKVMREDGIEKVLKGQTTVEEVLRVTQLD